MRPRGLRPAALLLAAAVALSVALPAETATAVVAVGALAVRAEGRAPIRDGRVDLAYDQALGEAFRRSLLEALRVLAPERQSPQDLETWQETILSRAGDFVGAWRILSQEQQDGFLRLEAEVEIWRDALARAARLPAAAVPAAALRILVLADALPLLDRASGEEVDAGRVAATALEAELARRGAVILSGSARPPWELTGNRVSDEHRTALAATEGRRQGADAVLVARLVSVTGGFALSAQLIAVSSETTLGSARSTETIALESIFSGGALPAARQVAATLAPRLGGSRTPAGRGGLP